MKKLFCVLLLMFSVAKAQTNLSLPERPTQNHPSDSNYTFQFKKETVTLLNRQHVVYWPVDQNNNYIKSPILFFGHGQALNFSNYELMAEHFAKKGVATAYSTFDTGFFDQNWRRMAMDFNGIAFSLVGMFPERIDTNQIHYAGHSKGGYIALMAAGEPTLKFNIASLVLFAPAGYDAEYLQKIDPSVPVTLIWGDQDTIIKKDSLLEIYQKLSTQFKQFIEVKSYDTLAADHFFSLTKASFAGGPKSVNDLHYYGSWKWSLSAVLHDQYGPFIYGDEAASTGLTNLKHTVLRPL